ncbi:DNA-binding transcriptional LysR family regulator OS=Ureibacillus acetophenoni OX=614649 GN=SAMN05877842_102170 PE=3 SV=1 [Ureibacillus acetophenoni]
MDFTSLMYFKTVAKYENMSRASEHLHISQPALSKSISLLEENLGVILFDRYGRSIKLNRYGRFFLERVEIMLREYERTKEDLQNMVAPGHGEVSLGFMHTLGLEVIPLLMTDAKKLFPNMKFLLTQSNSSVLMKKLDSGELDLCLISSFETNSDVVWEKLWDEELFLIVPKTHALSKKEIVKVAEFAHLPFICIKKGNSLRQSVDHLFSNEGYKLNVAFEGEEVHTLAGLVESGLGVSLIPKIKGLELYNLNLIRVDSNECKREIGLAYIKHRYLSEPTTQFANYIRDYFNGNKKGLV